MPRRGTAAKSTTKRPSSERTSPKRRKAGPRKARPTDPVPKAVLEFCANAHGSEVAGVRCKEEPEETGGACLVVRGRRCPWFEEAVLPDHVVPESVRVAYWASRHQPGAGDP
ncbi:protein of unknown function [Candidatus Hydrogenisulfobacillus filiaventi]|uniref:Uncharacterized protein n=1 Tax=Candidatus Hydrogenisulfobacillus filiaventi TaxID=2707344 RepID=A0A6F8ZHZ0_9FIRM|nr:protein of unknown function [Candidatus Hydrogenisulfobacillus filiaventi]